MKDELDRNSPLPLHYQIREVIRREVMSELLDKEGKIATETELAKRFKVSRITVRNAIKNLVDEGLLYRERGRGTFVQKNVKVEDHLGKLIGIPEMIKNLGFQPTTKSLHRGMTTDVPKKAKEKLMVENAWEYRRIRYADNFPIGLEHSYFPPYYGEILEEQDDLEENYGFEYFEHKFGIMIEEGEQMISAVNANEKQAELLQITAGSSLLYIERVTYSIQRKPVVFLQAIYNPNHFQYHVNLKK